MASDQHGTIEVESNSADYQGDSGLVEASSHSPTSTTPRTTSTADSKAHLVQDDVASNPRKWPLSNRIKHAFGLKSAYWTFKYDVPEIIKRLKDYGPGYDRAAAFEDCDPSFLIFRKFGWLHNCVLLDLQDELQLLEFQLEEHNAEEKEFGKAQRLQSRRLDYENKISREELIINVSRKLAEYDELLLRTQKIQSIRKPSKKYQNALHNFIAKQNNIVIDELEWIKQRDDLASISRDADHGWLNSFVERVLRSLWPTMLLSIFRTRTQKEKSKDIPGLYLVSPYRIDVLVRTIVIVFASGVLLLPVYILFRLTPDNPSDVQHAGSLQILTIFLFTLFFSGSYSIFSKARRQEVFTATAAYCAVLVVFLGNSINVVMVSTASGT